ncbi:protein of unknown function [Nitrospira japonica]|uniref:Uncharacterized protein n=1 Tax=Nitrospira japonica TaxID=1325564 RepID=A0A1W1I1D9_9BACT|nr:protein of unknown function [Nitrospira japonica]
MNLPLLTLRFRKVARHEYPKGQLGEIEASQAHCVRREAIDGVIGGVRRAEGNREPGR